MAKKTNKYEYKLSNPFRWRGREISNKSTQEELEKFASECKLWKIFLKEKGSEK